MSTKLLHAVARQPERTYPVIRMGESSEHRGRRRVLPALGAALRAARGLQDINVAVSRVQNWSEGLRRFDYSRLEHYELGTVLGPDPLVLLAIADIYGQSVEDLLWLLKWNREHVGESVAPTDVAEIRDDKMRVDARDRDILRRFHELDADAQLHVLRTLDLEHSAAQVKGGARTPGGNFR